MINERRAIPAAAQVLQPHAAEHQQHDGTDAGGMWALAELSPAMGSPTAHIPSAGRLRVLEHGGRTRMPLQITAVPRQLPCPSLAGSPVTNHLLQLPPKIGKATTRPLCWKLRGNRGETVDGDEIDGIFVGVKGAACLPEPWRCCATTRAAGRGLILSTTPRVSTFLCLTLRCAGVPDVFLLCSLSCCCVPASCLPGDRRQLRSCRTAQAARRQDCPSQKAPRAFLSSDSCLYHPGVPIFHDALKVSMTAAAGWDFVPSRIIHPNRFVFSRCPGLVLLQEAHNRLL